MERKKSNYYEARGFSIYYFANAVFNIVSSPGAYLRGIEDILGDMKAEFLMRPLMYMVYCITKLKLTLKNVFPMIFEKLGMRA